MYRQRTLKSLILVLLFLAVDIACAASLRTDAAQAFASGKPLDLIVEYDDTAIEKVAKEMQKNTPNHYDDQKTLLYKEKKYRGLKNKVEQSIASRSDIKHIRSYNHLPISLKRVNSIEAINFLLTQPGIKAVYPNAKIKRAGGQAQNLPLINQPQVAFAGEKGAATTVVVIDDGIDFQNPAFGNCSTIGTPSETCHVVVSVDMISNPGSNNIHGTNVAAIVLAVAPSTKIASLNIFDANGWGMESDVIAAIDWAIQNKTTYNIVAINMSLGDDTHNTEACTNDWSSAAISRATSSGISVIAAAGNSGYTDGLPSPACSPDAISVGAVYDRNMGPKGFLSTPRCLDKTSQADQIACFSNSASNLTLFAPGVMINAGGINLSGTSQAAPHVAGAVAVLRSTYPNESISQIQTRMTRTGVQITDPRNNITIPRLNLLAAATPTNDMFANRMSLVGLSGSISGTTILASTETDEPLISGILVGESLWWKWTAPQSGQLTVNTNGSDFDSLLAIYTGQQLSSLIPIASINNTGSLGSPQTDLIMNVTEGTEYALALDVANGAPSSFVLNWNFNTNPQANLVALITQNNNQGAYTLTVTNNGSQQSSNMVVSVNGPSGISISAKSPNCSLINSVMLCTLAPLSNGSTQNFDFLITSNTIPTINELIATIAPASLTPLDSGLTVSFDSADIPTLPEWGMMLFGLTILLINLRTIRSKVEKYCQ